MHPALCLQVGASTLTHPATPYGTQPPPVQQAFGVKAAPLQVAFCCHRFNPRKKTSNSQLPRA